MLSIRTVALDSVDKYNTTYKLFHVTMAIEGIGCPACQLACGLSLHAAACIALMSSCPALLKAFKGRTKAIPVPGLAHFYNKLS